MYRYQDIKVVHLEITQKCQAACPMCDRNQNGGAENQHITNAELSADDCEKIFQEDFIKQLDTMFMCGNLGDPIVAKDTLEVFKRFRRINPDMWLSMNTNAGAKSTTWWGELARTIGRKGSVIFSVDGLQDTNHLYRQNVNWTNVERNMRAFIDAGGRARWDFIVFGHNEHQIDEARQLAKDWGVERFQVKKSARFFDANRSEAKPEHQAKNRKGQDTALIAQPTNSTNQNIVLLKQKEIEKTYGGMREYYDQCRVQCKVAKEGSIFVTAEGLLMPCCWTAGRMYKWWHKDPRVEQIWDFIDANGGKQGINIVENNLEDVMNGNLLPDIEQSWGVKGVANGRLGVCAMKCGEGFDAFSAQFK